MPKRSGSSASRPAASKTAKKPAAKKPGAAVKKAAPKKAAAKRSAPAKKTATKRSPATPARRRPPARKTVTSGAPPCPQCDATETHLCEPRAQRAVKVFEQILKHTKGDYARRPFVLAKWQSEEIVRPLFGWVIYDEEIGRWVRQYRIAWIELARKNGKSELLAGIALILLVADDEEGAEIYSCAKDRGQARKVFDVAERMVQLSPVLSRRLKINHSEKRITDRKTGSYYEVIAADAAGNLGHNPHGILFDEVLTQPDGKLWAAMSTAFGTRAQPLMVAATTAGDDPSGFCAKEHSICSQIEANPSLDPSRFVYMRNTPMDADPWDERNWHHANPGLGDFLNIRDLRREAAAAKLDPTKENEFRQFRLNQWVQQTTRVIPLHLWDRCRGPILATAPSDLDAALRSRRCFGGLDLSAKIDLTSLAWAFPDDGWQTVWRFWLPERMLPIVDRYTGGQAKVWAQQGWLTVTEGSVIDYDSIYETIDKDARWFGAVDISHDAWLAEPVRQELDKRHIDMYPVQQSYKGQSEPLKDFIRAIIEQGQADSDHDPRAFAHSGNPVARWNADCLEVRRDDAGNIRPVKPDRETSQARIDGMVAAINAWDGAMRRGQADAGIVGY